MRYIGNKTRLLESIATFARGLGLPEGGVVCDLFAGSGVVGRHFRGLGHRVISTDVMYCSWVFQRLFLECPCFPDFAGLDRHLELPATGAPDARITADTTLPGDARPLLRVMRYLENELTPREGILTRQYSEAGSAGRRYLRSANARRLDAVLLALREWRGRGWLDEPEEALLLAATIDAADRVANISGTYGAYLKEWQPNTGRPVELRLPRLVSGPAGAAHRCDARDWIGGIDADLLYIDPPYNHRQYPSNYHLLDVIARIPAEPDLAAFEASIYGKTGLVPWKERASQLCSGRGTECRDAFRSLLEHTRIPRVVISYSEEGIISREQFEEMLGEYSGGHPRRAGSQGAPSIAFEEISFPRFRSDADGRVARTGARRHYRTVPGRRRDEVCEWLLGAVREDAALARAAGES